MPVIKLNDQQFLLRPGTNRLGGGDFVEMTISPDVSLGVQAIIEVTGTEGVVIRPAPNKDSSVRVNGVIMNDPTPLLHGDKIEVAGKELSFSDDSKTGATTFVPRAEIAAVVPQTPMVTGAPKLGETVRAPADHVAPEPPPPPVVAPSGGRLVSLSDGREYPVSSSGMVIGRESASDVVLAHKSVSRKHATITPTLRGYELKDLSSNGVFVNGAKINSTHILVRADVIRIGKDEFRFYADASALAPTMAFQAFAAKHQAKTARETPARSRTPSSAHAVSSRLAYQEKRRGTPHTPMPAAATSAVSATRPSSRFGWLWVVVLFMLGLAAYYMLRH
jgi:hypothetical protein